MHGSFNSIWSRECGNIKSRYIGERLDNKERTSAFLCADVFSRQNDEQSSHPPIAIKALLYRQAMQLAEYFPLRSFSFMYAHSCIFDDKPEQPAIIYAAPCGVSCQFVTYLIVQPFSTGVLIILSPTRKETSYSDRRFWCSYVLFIIVVGGILVLFIYTSITRLASNDIFSPSNKIHREVGRAKDLSAQRY